MNRRYSRTACFGLTAILAAFTIFPLSATADHIDNFEAGPFSQIVTNGGPFVSFSAQNIAASGGANGGTRMVTTFFTGGSGAATTSLSIGALDDSVVLGADSFAGAAHMFSYSPQSADYLNIGPFSQWDRLSLDFISNSSGPVGITVNSNGNLASASAMYSPGTGTLDFLYSSFTGDPIDFSDIDGVTLLIQLSGNGAGGPGSFSASNFYRSGFVVVPEPATAVVWLAGGVMAIATARRRRI